MNAVQLAVFSLLEEDICGMPNSLSVDSANAAKSVSSRRSRLALAEAINKTAFGESIGLELPTRYDSNMHALVDALIAADAAISPVLFGMSSRTIWLCRLLAVVLLILRNDQPDMKLRERLELEAGIGVLLIAVAVCPVVNRPATFVMRLAAITVVSSTKAEPVALPEANVKKRVIVADSRSMSATDAASPSGTAACRPRTDIPVGVMVVLAPSAICCCVAGLPCWKSVTLRPRELTTTPTS